MSFYVERRMKGEFLILDNGAYEKDYDEQSFVEAIEIIRPHVACLPDIILDSEPSRLRSLHFMKQWAGHFPDVRWMYIPQGKDMVDWCEALSYYPDFLMRDNRTWLGLTRFLCTDTYPVSYIRVDAAKWIRSRWPACHIHAMGMAAGDVGELAALAEGGNVESCDSSAPVWRGWNRYSLESPISMEAWDAHGTEVNFDAPLPTTAATHQINDNLEVVFSAARLAKRV